MKRTLSLILALCMVFAVMALAACGESKPKIPETAHELFNSATEKTQQLNCYEGVMDITMSLDMMGITLSMPMAINIKAQDLKTESPKIAMDMSMSMMGENIDMEMYTDGQWAYVVALGQSYKTPVAAAENNYSDYVGDILKELPEDLLEGVAVTVNEDGTRSFEAAITSDSFKTIYADFIMELAASAMGAASGLESITIKDSKIAATVTEDLYFSAYSLSFGVELSVSGMTADMDIAVDLTYVEPGKDVVVTFPEGYEDFAVIDTGL